MEKDKSYISCGGPNTESNHPKVYIHVSTDKTATCPYCGKVTSPT